MAPKPNTKAKPAASIAAQLKAADARADAAWSEVKALREDAEARFTKLNMTYGAIKAAHDAELSASHKREMALREENNKLRDLVRDGELEAARLNGYLQRIDDEKPPKMVEEQRQPREQYRQQVDFSPSVKSLSYDHYGEKPPRRWYHDRSYD